MRVPAAATLTVFLSSLASAAAQTPPPVPAAAAASSPVGVPLVEGARGLQPSVVLGALPKGDAAAALPIVMRAQSMQGQLNGKAVAEGDAEFRRGGLVIKADRLSYEPDTDQATASGHVRIVRDGAVYSGPALNVRVQAFQGSFDQPAFELAATGGSGRARRIDFISPTQSVATDARYTSCPREDDSGADTEPAWELQTTKLHLDTANNVGIAEGARLRFLGTTILALPTMSFALGDQRKSGWLPPSLSIDSRGGLELSVPYYLDLAPNRDLTLAPRVITRRGAGLDGEFRYLEPQFDGRLAAEWLPNDRVADRSRYALEWQHQSRLPADLRLSAAVLRVSDDDWWKDFPNRSRSLTSRLLGSHVALERPFEMPGVQGTGLVYARANQWQVLQASESFITAPYQREPQVGLRVRGQRSGWAWNAETEFNRFTLPDSQAASTGRVQGSRVHAVAGLSYPWREPGWWLVPRLSINAARYAVDGQNEQQHRVIPSFSIDAGLELERSTEAFGRALRQTLEPRVFYVNTPYRQQSQLPNFDAAAKDFNFTSIYSDNTFSGVDRVADLHQLTAGFTTRLVDMATGAEALRLGLVQRFLFRSQQVAPKADGSPDGEVLSQRFSDALLLGSTNVLPGWTLDGAVQYSPDINRSIRSIAGARYSPGPFRTVGATYRLARGLSEQLELGWQWPLWGAATVGAPGETPSRLGQALARSGSCQGTWYSVGRLNYSLKDRRLTDSVLGLEYDAGCWIGRFVVEQLSTGRSEATTRYLIQLELVGLSRLGSNPLRVLKDNIPGYRLLREDRGSGALDPTDRSILSPSYE